MYKRPKTAAAWRRSWPIPSNRPGARRNPTGSRTPVSSDRGPAPAGPYTPAIRHGELLFISGQVGVEPATRTKVEGDFAAEARQTLTNLQALVEAGGSSMEQVLKVTVYLTDMALFAELNTVYQAFFPEPRPARTTVQAGLAHDYRIEIDAIAAV